jgi:transposase InsO family protein
MKLHGNARTCPNSRRLLVERIEGREWSLAAAAAAAGVSERTAYRWLKRWREEGSAGLVDRSSRPRRSPRQLPAGKVEAIEKLRRLWMTAAQIAEMLGLALSTVSLWLKRIGLGRRSRLEPPEPPNRYERRHPGELVHIDIKTLGRISARGAGWRMTGSRKSQFKVRDRGPSRGVTRYEYVHVAVDDHSRLAYAEVLDGLGAAAAVGFLERAVDWFSERGIAVEQVMTDNGSAYVSFAHREVCAQLGIQHLRIKPARPRTNGKAERFIQTLKNEWAYARIYGSSTERAQALPFFLNHYNYRRPHGSLGHKPPASRLTNVVRNYT